MIGRPASAYGSAAAAARDASLRLRHHGLRLRRDERSPSPRSAKRRTPPSTSVSDTRESLLHRLRLRRDARSPTPPSPPIETLPFASAAREDLRRLHFHGMDGSPSPPSRPASASNARGYLHRLHIHGMDGSPSPPSRPASASAALDRAIRGIAVSPSSASTTEEALQRGRPRREAPSPPPPSPPRGERPSASASATREALDRAIHGTGISPSAAAATQEALRLRHPRCEVLPPSLLSPPPGELHSASASSEREVLRRTLTASSPPLRLHGMLASTICSPLLTEHPVTSMATLRASLALRPPEKPSDEETSGPVLIITNPEFSGSTLFSPYSMRAFTRSNFPIDIMGVLYSDGDFFLLKEGTSVSIWEVKSETRLFTIQLGVDIEQGYFRGTPSSDLTIVLARQRVFAYQIDNADDEEQGDQDILAEFWLRRNDGAWQQNAVVCAHLGMHSLIIHDDSLFWLSDDGTLCSVAQTQDGLLLVEWEGAVESVDNSFSLLEHLNNLYIVKSGGTLPNAAAIYRVVPGDPPAFPETRINGKDVFIVHGKSAFLLPNQTSDSRVFSAPLIVDADCSRFSYQHNRHDNIRPCQSEFFHHWCSAAWAVMQSSQ